jgi:hypothetical protein
VPNITLANGEKPFAGTKLDQKGYIMNTASAVKYYEDFFKIHQQQPSPKL